MAIKSILENVLMRVWMRRGVLAYLLWPLSILFGLLVRIRRSLYAHGWKRVTHFQVPIIVVGNIFIGGTGKTPLTIGLLEILQRAGYRPGVVSRGYGRKTADVRYVTAATPAAEVGDEPVLIAERTGCPVMVGRQRVAATRALLAAHPELDVIIADDGLQHYAMARDIEIIVFDERDIGNGWLLPAGPLREPVSRRRDFTVLNTNTGTMQLYAERAERLQDRSQRQALSTLQKNNVSMTATAGMGNPARFFAILRQAGLHFQMLVLSDHDHFTNNPFIHVSSQIILMTEKDAVKCRDIPGISQDPRIWVVPVTVHISDTLVEQILEKLRAYSIA